MPPLQSPSSPLGATDPREVPSARWAVVAAFVLAGFAFASWASRLPETRVALHLTPGGLGLLLLVIAVGSVVSLPLSGGIANRLGTARATVVGALVDAVGLAGAGLASGVAHSVPLTALALLAVGVGTGLWDVSMNLEGAAVEQRLQRAVMPTFHAGFSGGTVLAAGAGALMAHLRVPVAAHLSVVAILALVLVLITVRRYLPRRLPGGERPASQGAAALTSGAEPESGAEPTSAGGSRPRADARPASAWTEPRTLLIGLVVLAAAFTEGTANDWFSVAAVDGYGLSPASGALALGLFLFAMTLARFLGQRALDRWGRVPVVRATLVMAGVGALLVVFGHWVLVAGLGALLWGSGASLGFPVGISAAADDPARAAARVSVVTTIGYTAFLGGPPLLGFLGDHLGVLHALAVVAVLVVPSLAVSGVLATTAGAVPADLEPASGPAPSVRP